MGIVRTMGSLTGKLAVKSAAGTAKAVKPVKLAAPTRSGLGEKVKKPLADVLDASAKKAIVKPAAKDIAARKVAVEEPADKRVAAKEVPVKKAAAKEVPAEKTAAKKTAAKKTAAKKTAAKKPGNTWQSVKLPPSNTGWWKVTTNSKTNGGSWNYSWKFNDKKLAQMAVADLRAIDDLQLLEGDANPSPSMYMNVANLRNVATLIGKS